jgi:soluble lytic murein transglycosylase-like protein
LFLNDFLFLHVFPFLCIMRSNTTTGRQPMSTSIRYAHASARRLSRSTLGFRAVWARARMPAAACAAVALFSSAACVWAYLHFAAHRAPAVAATALAQSQASAPASLAVASAAQLANGSASGAASAPLVGAGAPKAAQPLRAGAPANAAPASHAELGKLEAKTPGAQPQPLHVSPKVLAAAKVNLGATNAQPAADRVARVIAKRYRIALEAATMITREAFDAAGREKIDPLLSLSVIAVESHFNPFSASVVGALGLTQTLPSAHPEEMSRVDNQRAGLLDVRANIHAGARILAACERRYPGSDAMALQCYNGNVADKSRSYSGKVLAVRSLLRQALAPAVLPETAVAKNGAAKSAPARVAEEPATQRPA